MGDRRCRSHFAAKNEQATKAKGFQEDDRNVSTPTHTLNESHFAVSSKGRFHSARHCRSCSARQTSRPALGKGWFDPAQPYEEEVCAAADPRSKTARLPKSAPRRTVVRLNSPVTLPLTVTTAVTAVRSQCFCLMSACYRDSARVPQRVASPLPSPFPPRRAKRLR